MRLFAKSLKAFCGAASVAGVFALAFLPGAARADWGAFDGGGRVGDYLDLVSTANQTGQKIEISGVCASACTMKLGARNVCIRPDAELWFHAARNDDGQINGLATLMMMEEYPHGIRAWASASGALATKTFTTMSGARAIALGVPDCNRDNAAQSASLRDDNVAKVCRAEPVAYSPTFGAAACFRRPQFSPAWTAQASTSRAYSIAILPSANYHVGR